MQWSKIRSDVVVRKWGNRKRRTLPYLNRDWFRQYKALAAREPYHVLLESGQGGRYSIIGLTPAGVIQAKENQLFISYRGEEKRYEGNPLLSLKQWFAQFPLHFSKSELPFQGGAIGYISYDCARYIEKIPYMHKTICSFHRCTFSFLTMYSCTITKSSCCI